jgi:transposase InsO family protein
MHEIVAARIRFGYRRVHILLKREGWLAGKNVVYRLYREEGLCLRPERPRRRKMAVHREARCQPSRPDQAWSLDFVHNELSNGNKIRLLTAANPIQIISRKDWAWSALIVIGGERQSYFSPFIGLLCRNPTGDRR